MAFGNYVNALKREECQKAFTFKNRSEEKSNSLPVGEFYKQNFKAYLEAEGNIAEKVVFCIGVSCLQLFVQNNFCGPVVGPSHTFIPNLIPVGSNEAEIRERALEELVLLNVDGIYGLVSHPELLIVAKIIFVDLQNCLSSFISTNWWCFRYAIVHQKIVDDSSGTLGDIIFKCLSIMERSSITDRERFSDLYALFHLEAGNCSLFYFKINRAKAHINNALLTLGLKINECGDLKIRKRMLREQIKDSDSRQTVLNSLFSNIVISNLRSIQHMALFVKIVLLDRSEFRSENLIKNCKSLLKYLLEYAENWALRLSLKFQRLKGLFCEADSAENSLTQINDLVESNFPDGFIRLKLIYSSSLLTKWNLLKERVSMSSCFVESSLQMYEKLHLWDALISSYKKLKTKETPVKIIKKLLDKKETAEFWCLLGDATNDISYYNKALEVRKGNSYRADRSLGDYFYNKEEYNLAFEHYENCIERNPHNYDVFRKLIYCTTRGKMWHECVVYCKKYLTDSDDFYVWSSLTQAYINLGEQVNARDALKESWRFKEDWALWNHYVAASTSSGYFEDALNAYDYILKCEKGKFDWKTLENLANSIIKKKDTDVKFMKNFYKKLLQIVNKICRQFSKDSDIQFLYAELLYTNPEGNQHTKYIAIQHYRKSVAIYAQITGWEELTDVTNLIITRCLKLIKLYIENLDFKDVKSSIFFLSSLRYLVRRIITRVKEGYVLNDDSVKASLRSLEEEEGKLENLTKDLQS